MNEMLVCCWCGEAFVRRFRRGRRPLYCSRTCRQRAFEDRRRCAHERGRPSATSMLGPPRFASPMYEGGTRNGRWHALRPDGVPDRWRQRPTLCGTRAAWIRRPFDGGALARDTSIRAACRRCVAIAARYPAPRYIDPSPDLAAVTLLAGHARTLLDALPADAPGAASLEHLAALRELAATLVVTLVPPCPAGGRRRARSARPARDPVGPRDFPGPAPGSTRGRRRSTGRRPVLTLVPRSADMTAEPHHDSSDPAPRPGVDPDDIVLHDDEQTQAGAQVARAGPRRSGEPGEGGDDDPTLRPDPGGGPTIP